ncbi:unnamed protein product [Haemonchus placei]|uniref:Uncharacterized protein n=1 Tax=Haemonchus placei TaxID=6290 RepID=A0A0N4XAN2_HAEPC|nr:unnamed protein product [Haemonchus placei]
MANGVMSGGTVSLQTAYSMHKSNPHHDSSHSILLASPGPCRHCLRHHRLPHNHCRARHPDQRRRLLRHRLGLGGHYPPRHPD